MDGTGGGKKEAFTLVHVLLVFLSKHANISQTVLVQIICNILFQKENYERWLKYSIKKGKIMHNSGYQQA